MSQFARPSLGCERRGGGRTASAGSSSTLQDLTPQERDIFERLTERSAFGPRAQLHIGAQRFDIWPDQESEEDVDWMRAMLARALAAFSEDFTASLRAVTEDMRAATETARALRSATDNLRATVERLKWAMSELPTGG